jgi:hypothetical protein
MPKGPQGQKRKADVIGNAVLVMKLATGECEEEAKPKTAAETSGSKGGTARAANLTKKQRSEIARKGAAKRWKD